MKPPEQEIMSMLTFFYLLNLAQILTMISYHNIRSFYIQFIEKKIIDLTTILKQLLTFHYLQSSKYIMISCHLEVFIATRGR